MLNQSDQKRDVQGKLIAQARHKKKKKKEDCQNILLFTVMWLAKENMSVHRLILYLHCCRFQHSPIYPSFLREQSWAWSGPWVPLALWLLRCLLWS